MKNKFLIGARLAGVMLALLFGVSSAWATYTVEVDLTKIQLGTGGHTAKVGKIEETTNAARDSVLAIWTPIKGPNGPQNADSVGAVASLGIRQVNGTYVGSWAAAGATGNAVTHYDSILTIKLGTNVSKVVIKGDVTKQNSFPKIKQILFKGGNATSAVVEWDGAAVKAAGPVATGTPDPADVEEFLRWGKSWDGTTGWTAANDAADRPFDANDKVSAIHLIDGSIETWAKYVLKGVGGVNYNTGVTDEDRETDAKLQNLVGHYNVGKAVGRSITLLHHGKGAAIQTIGCDIASPGTDERAAINPPRNGTYTITSDGLAIEVAEGPTGGAGKFDVSIGNTGKAGEGKIVIQAWDKATTSATSAAAGAAIVADNIKLNGKDISGNNKGVVVKSRGKYVLNSAGKVIATSAEIQHAAATGTAGAVAIYAVDEVELTSVKGNNGTANGAIAGVWIGTGGDVTVEGGTYTAATGGTAISTPTGDVVIKGSKIWSNGSATKPAYVVSGKTVALISTATDSAVVAWAGSGSFAVGGVTGRAVYIYTNYSHKAEVRVAGAGIGVSVQTTRELDYAAEVVHVRGNPTTSAFINTASGQAIKVENNLSDGGVPVYVYIDNAKIARTATNASTPLVDVVGGHVFVRGTTVERMSMSAGSDAAIFATKNINGVETSGGKVWINGGAIAGVNAAVRATDIYVEEFYPDIYDNDLVPEDGYATTLGGTPATDFVLTAANRLPGTLTTVLSSTSGITVNAISEVMLNNGYASVINTSTANDDPVKGVRSAAVYSLLGGVDVFNVDSIKTANAIGILTVKEGGVGAINVFGGKVKSTSAYAISSSGDVLVDWSWVTGVTATVGGVVTRPSAGNQVPAYMTSGTNIKIGLKRNKIEVSTNATTATACAIYAPFATESYTPFTATSPITYGTAKKYTVRVGDARVFSNATSGGAAGIVVNKASVTIAHMDAQVISQSGTGVRVNDADVYFEAGDIVSNPSSGNFAGIWVVNGNAYVGATVSRNQPTIADIPVWWTGGDIKSLTPALVLGTTPGTPGTYGTDFYKNFVNRSSVSSNGAIAVYLDGAGEKFVKVGYYGLLSVKGTGATAGMIKVTKKNWVNVEKNAQLISTGSQAFAIEAEEGLVRIDGGRIESLASKQAISTKGGDIVIGGDGVNSGILQYAGSAYRHIDGGKEGVRITGNEGVLVRAIKNGVTGRAGEVVVNGGFIYNKYGTGVWADDTLRIKGGEIVTDKDTAVRAGTTTAVGLIDIGVNTVATAEGGLLGSAVQVPEPHVWAAAQYAKATPVAVAARMVRINGGTVEANTIKSSADNTSTYPDSKAIGILLKKGPGTPVFKVGAKGTNLTKRTRIIAHGANTAIDCQDSAVTLDIMADNVAALKPDSFRISVNGDNLGLEPVQLAGTVTVKAGDNGIAIKSVGEIKINGTVVSETSKNSESGLAVGIYIGAGNGTSARAITMPVPANANKHKDLTLENAFVEAGSDGATAIDADAKAIVRVDHSVVLVRHLSTAINGKGGVYIDAGYVEVLATENNTVGTAVTGRNIRISGGAGATGEENKSEIHSKGIAVKDNVEGAVVQVTGRIHMSGTVASNMKIGASVVTDTGVLTMGSVKSRNLWRLTTVSDQTVENEKGKALYIPLGVTIEVGDNGSSLGTEKSDTIHVEGVVTTVGKQAGAKFLNGGRILIEKGGNVKFNKGSAESFKNSEGAIIVLKTGSLLDDSLLVHDTGLVNERKAYTFLKWAKLLSGDSIQTLIGNRGPGRVIVPPMYATLYGNQRIYVDEEDRDEEENDFWTAKSERTDSAYTAKFVLYPLDRRYKPYFETEDFLAKGDFTLGGQGTVKVDEDGTVMLTEAGKFTRTATMDNEAGTGTKTYTHIVERVDLNRVIANQTEGPIFFDGYFYNKNRRVVGHDGEDTVTVREGNVEVKYTGGTAHLLDGIKGAEIEGYTDIATDKPIYFAGLGDFTYWYKGSGDTYYPLTSSIPKNVGTYDVYVSATQGNNFEAIPSDDRSIVPIGTVNVVEGDVESVFGKKDNESYQLVVDLEAKVAKSGVKVALPSVLRFGAKYDNENIEISGTGETALVGNPTLPDSILTFSVNATSEVGKFIEFKATILNTADPANLTEGNFITVRARFLSKEDMKEIKPSYITVNYRDEKLKGLLAGTTYTINGQTLIATSSDTTISEEWVGKTISVVALPGVGSYKTASDTAKIVVGVRPEVTDSLRAVKGENAKTNLSVDGRLTHTSSSMEYKTAADTAWRQASPVVTTGLPTGTYSVRLAPTATAFPSASVTVLVGFDSTVTVLAAEREIPNKNVTKEVAVAPVAKVTATFTAGPSPVSKNGTVKFFSSKQVKSGTMYVYDATGKSVAKLNAKSNGREIGSWNLRDKKGAVVAEGSYVVKGKLVNKDGTKESVSALFNVTK